MYTPFLIILLVILMIVACVEIIKFAKAKTRNKYFEEQSKELYEQRTDLSNQRTDLHAQRTDSHAQRIDLKDQRTDLGNQRTDLSMQRNDMQEQRGDLEHQRDDLKIQREDLKSQRTDLQNQRLDLKEQRDNAVEHQEKIKALEYKLQEEKQKFIENTTEAVVQDLKRDVDEANRAREKLTSKLKKKGIDTTHLDQGQEIRRLHEVNSSLWVNQEKLNTELLTAEMTLEEVKSKFCDYKDAIIESWNTNIATNLEDCESCRAWKDDLHAIWSNPQHNV